MMRPKELVVKRPILLGYVAAIVTLLLVLQVIDLLR